MYNQLKIIQWQPHKVIIINSTFYSILLGLTIWGCIWDKGLTFIIPLIVLSTLPLFICSLIKDGK